MHRLRRAIDRGSLGLEAQFASRLGVEILGFEHQALNDHIAGEIGLGQWRALIGRKELVAHQRDRASIAFGAQTGHGLRARLAGAENDDPLGHACVRAFLRSGVRAF